jgi:hypothetical protein
MTGVSGLAGLFGGGLKQQAADAETDRLLKADATRGQIDLYGAQAEKARTDAAQKVREVDLAEQMQRANLRAREMRADPEFLAQNAAYRLGIPLETARVAMTEGAKAGLGPEQLRLLGETIASLHAARTESAEKGSGVGDIATLMKEAGMSAQRLAAPGMLATDPNRAAFMLGAGTNKGAPDLFAALPGGMGTFGAFTGAHQYDPGLHDAAVAKDRASANASNASAARTRQQIEQGNRTWDADRGGFIDWRTGAFVPAMTAEGTPIGPKPTATAKPTYDSARGIQINPDGTATPVTVNGQPIGGKPLSPADQARIDRRNREAGRARAALDQSVAELDRLGEIAREVKDHPGLKGITGIPGMFPNIPGTDRANAAAKLDTLKSQVAFRVLQTMRDMSKTGGALGQVSDRENTMLQNNLAALDRAQSYEEFQRELGRVIEFVDGVKSRMQQAYTSEFGDPDVGAGPPRAGEIVDGYRYRGGDPADRESWEPVESRP